jgi:hypothetical protein
VWFNSRFYRLNLLWENNTLRFRDIHIFDENLASEYLTQKGTSTKCDFYTLPFVDGYLWSSSNNVAGLRFKTTSDGVEKLIEGGIPTITDSIQGKLNISWPLTSIGGKLLIDIDENNVEIRMDGNDTTEWFLDLTTTDNTKQPFEKVAPHQIDCLYRGMEYSVTTNEGIFSEPGNGIIFRIAPEGNLLKLNLSK